MLSVEELQEKFTEILKQDPSLSAIANSQFSKHLATFCGWALRDAQFKSERALQEFFLGTAMNASSILAQAEDREYLPRKPVPSTGVITITNGGANPVSIPMNREFVSDTSVPVVSAVSVSIPAGGSVTVDAIQKQLVNYDFTVDEAKAFYEVLLPAETTRTAAEIAVTVDIQDSLGYKAWTYARLLQNTFADSKVYDEFFTHSDQIGIRFGNGTFGMIPPLNSAVRVSVWETQGNVYLTAGQSLFPVNEIVDTKGQPASLSITVATAFTGGSDLEDIEEMRRNLHYWPVYNEKLVWADDYKYFLRRRFPELIFVQAWGEEKAEEMAGAPSLAFVNKIFVCAYANREGVQADCMAALPAAAPMNRKFQWVEPEHVSWTLALTGSVLPDVVTADAVTAIKEALYKHYGKDSVDRRDTVHLSEVYEVIQATGYFEQRSGARFTIELAGTHQTALLYQMVSIDIDNCTFNLSYV